ncbi:MAG: hypothetical protein AB1725_06710 [Armatimonadota bacterium]
MIKIEYELENQEIQETLSLLKDTPAAALDETCFESRVRMSVGGIEMFGSLETPRVELKGENWSAAEAADSAWAILPILALTGALRNQVDELPFSGKTRFLIPGGGEIRLKRDGAEVSLESSLSGQTATCRYEELKDTLRGFASQVEKDLARRAPELKKHPLWHTWFS